jgi:hypothetical protein
MSDDFFIEELIEIQNAGHACRFEPSVPRLTFLSDFTTPDHVLWWRGFYPALDKMTVRCAIPE